MRCWCQIYFTARELSFASFARVFLTLASQVACGVGPRLEFRFLMPCVVNTLWYTVWRSAVRFHPSAGHSRLLVRDVRGELPATYYLS